jgi:hypothetical protein
MDIMSSEIEYCSPATEMKTPGKIYCVVYLMLALPGVVSMGCYVFYHSLAEFIVNHFEHPIAPWDWWECQWRWEDRVQAMGGEAALAGFAITLAFVISAYVPPAKRWLKAHVPWWPLAMPLYLMVVVIACCMPQFRN